MLSADIKIEFRGDHIYAQVDGPVDYAVSEKVWNGITEMCQENGCYHVLGVSTITKPMNYAEAYDHYKLFKQLGIDNRYKIAWVEHNKISHIVLKFIESVLRNRGLPGKLFKDELKAKSWLLQVYA